jgi:2',3'-cyclic-nucleotide 2'-phosphodiesterase (5'-nucleotidase family)
LYINIFFLIIETLNCINNTNISNLGGKTVKSFSISKLTTGVLISLLAVSLVGCSTTSNKVESATEIPTVAQPEKEAAQPKGDGAILVVPVVEAVKEEAPIVEVNPAEVTVAELTVAEETVAEEIPEVQETTVVVEETPAVATIEYPLGIVPIVKSDANYPVFDLFIVHTADSNGTVNSSSDSVGYAKLSTMMQVARSLTNNILLIDAGNALSGSLLNDETNGEASGALLYMLGYDVFVPQFSDYSFDDSSLLDAAKLAKNNSNIKVLSANTLDSEEYLPFQPYQLYDFNGFKVCVVGLTGPFVQDGVDFTFDSETVLQSAQYALDVASQYADYIVVVGSMDTVSSKFICENLNGIDLFIDGSNSEVGNGTIINGTTIVNTEANMAEVGVVDVVVKNGEVSLVAPMTIMAKDVNDPTNSELASAYGISSIPEDANVAAYISSQEKSVDAILSKPVVNLPYSLLAEDSIKSQSSMAKFFVNSLTESKGVDASIISGGVFVKSIVKGDVSTKDIKAAIVSNADICLAEMTGAQIYAALEVGYSTLPIGGQYFTQTDLKVVYNKYAKPGKRILRVKLGSKYIEKDSTYIIATDSLLSNSENGYDMGTVLEHGEALNVSLYNMLVAKYPAK